MMSVQEHMQRDEAREIARRKAALAVLAHAEGAEIAACLEAVALPAYEKLREAESGLRRCRARCRRRPAATAPRPNRHPAWSPPRPRNGARKYHGLVTKQSFHFGIELSNIIDNLIPARLKG